MMEYLSSLVVDVVSKYDVDGIHLDYVRYPDNAMKFPDTDSFRKWGSRSKSLFRWREDNITGIVTAIYEEVKRLKPGQICFIRRFPCGMELHGGCFAKSEGLVAERTA